MRINEKQKQKILVPDNLQFERKSELTSYLPEIVIEASKTKRAVKQTFKQHITSGT